MKHLKNFKILWTENIAWINIFGWILWSIESEIYTGVERRTRLMGKEVTVNFLRVNKLIDLLINSDTDPKSFGDNVERFNRGFIYWLPKRDVHQVQ